MHGVACQHQSDQGALETLAAAVETVSVPTREQPEAGLKLKGHARTALEIGAITRLRLVCFRSIPPWIVRVPIIPVGHTVPIAVIAQAIVA